MHEALLVGNSLAVLLAADLLARGGRDVVLLTDHGSLGGHFRGVDIGHHRFDIGMFMFERAGSSLPGTSRPVEGVDSWVSGGDLVDEVLFEHLDLVRAPTPQALVHQRRWPDHLIANRLDVLTGSSLAPPEPVAADDPLHPSRKNESSAFDSLAYSDAAVSSHGPEVHEALVAPFVRKVAGDLAGGLLARHHRAAWAPLYWPETIADALAGRASLDEYPFWVDRSGSGGGLVRALEDRVVSSRKVTVIDDPLSSLRLDGSAWVVESRGGRRWRSQRMALGTGVRRARELLGMAPAPEVARAPVSVVFCLVRSAGVGDAVTCLNVVDREWSTYRITDLDAQAGRDPVWRRVVVEASGGAGAGDPVSVVAELRAILDIDDERDVQVLEHHGGGAVTIPTAVEAGHGMQVPDLEGDLPGILLTGALCGVRHTSMNEQIRQGARASKELS